MRFITSPLRLISLSALILLILTLSSCILGVEAPFEVSPVDYFGYLEDETPEDIKISGKLDSSVSCVLTVKNNSDKDYYCYNSYALYRWINGEWLPVKKCRSLGDDVYTNATSYSGEETELLYNWDYEYGRLGKGSYKLVTACYETISTNTSLVSYNFKLSARPLSQKPEDKYGYLAAGDNEDLTMTVERITPHRFRVAIKRNGEIYYNFDRTYALYYKSGDKWRPVEQRVEQPSFLWNGGYPGFDGKYTISLSPFYGALPAGDYLLVKRGLLQGEINWYGRPSSDYTYISAEFHLDKDLEEEEYEPELLDWYGWYEDSPELNEIETSVTNLTAESCTINMVNKGEGNYQTGNGSPVRLYKLIDSEWLPVKQSGYSGDGLIPLSLPPHNEASLYADWRFEIGRLSIGTYRLVKDFSILSDKGITLKKNLLKSWEFEITEKMAAEKPDNPYGYSEDSPLLEDAILTLEKLDSHRFKVALIRDGESKASADLSFALYEEKDGEWLPVPYKYDILRHYYRDKEGFYSLRTRNLKLPADNIIDLTALYDKLKPGSYRLVKRYGGDSLSGEYRYVTADLVYTGY